MNRLMTLKAAWIASAALLCSASGAFAGEFNIPAGDLKAALNTYMSQTGVELIYPEDQMGGLRTKGAAGVLAPEDALVRILKGTGFSMHHESGAIAIVRDRSSLNSANEVAPMQLAQASPPARTAVETVTVTSSKLGGGDVQSIPISITALSQEQLTATQTNGGPDLIKQVPNMTFTKTNFSGYSIQIRGIGTQAISVTTDPAVAVAFNDMPFIRNHFFEQEFFDLGQVEVVRGPQGTLYGRNATAGVVNLTPAKPTDQFEAMASAELGNYHQRRFEGMINIPIVDDRLAVRLAGEWTKRQGYSFNALTDQRIDGRDLWSGRMSIGFKPIARLQAYLVWEHFSESDDRLRSGKQLCKRDAGPDFVNGRPVDELPVIASGAGGPRDFLSQGCSPVSLYSQDAFQVPNGFSLPYFQALGAAFDLLSDKNFDPYVNTRQSQNLRVIESTLDPVYKTKSDLVQVNVNYSIYPSIAFISQTGFNNDFMFATQDYNRFNTAPGLFRYNDDLINSTLRRRTTITQNGEFCDPQLGCSSRLVAQDLVKEHSWQLNQEFRLASHFDGPFNFSLGGNYMHYETAENYYVFINTLTAFMSTPIFGGGAALGNIPWVGGVSDNHECLLLGSGVGYLDPRVGSIAGQCGYIDPNPIGNLNDQGHNYFLSQNPYQLDSYAAFGEADYKITDDLKLIGGLRFTKDRKHFTMIPSELAARGYGYPVLGVIDQSWGKFTGRFVANWMPKFDFTDQTLIYGSYARGYKAGGANPPGAVLLTNGAANPIHPLAFEPEYVNAFEVGTKNTLLDGALTFNASAFYYDYKGYQISEIVDRTSINLNFDAKVKGAEIETVWEPMPGLRFNLSGGWEKAELAKNAKAVDLMDRTAGRTDWVVIKPGITEASNCIIPAYVAAVTGGGTLPGGAANGTSICSQAYVNGLDPALSNPQYTPADYPGFDPISPTATNHGAGPVPNNGAGFDKDLSGNELPNAPPLTASAGAQYTIPLSADWAGTLRGDYYWQDYSWVRVFNDRPYDRLRGYTNVNLTLILTSQSGWQVMLYDKNVFNTTAITGAFLNSDDSGLTTNVFLTDPKLIGVRVTKNW